MFMELHQKQTQTLVITPQMEQAIKILEMNTQALAVYVQILSLENPVVDLDAIHCAPGKDEKDRDDFDDWQGIGASFSGRFPASGFPDSGQPVPDTLQAHLLEQALLDCPQALYPVVAYVSGFINENGYLDASVADMAAWGAFSQDDLERAVAYVQRLEPSGVGARSLSECLLLQLPEGDTVARRIAADYLDNVAKGRHSQTAKALGVSVADLAGAVARIKKLNPKPGSGFGSPHMPPYITPDVVVEIVGGVCHVRLCPSPYQTISANPSYIELLRQTDDETTKAYVGKQIRQLRWVQQCIENRSETLLNVAKTIVSRQERFFLSGPQHMGVLRMVDIARALDLHESTVSRAVKDKHLTCRHGIFPLKYFFVQGVGASNADGIVSSHDVKHRIKALINRENKSTPLSDRQIALMLENQGIQLSRRTVVKYREQLRIPGSQYRRERG
jgi:RNA polymerase sigma-54 factor